MLRENKQRHQAINLRTSSGHLASCRSAVASRKKKKKGEKHLHKKTITRWRPDRISFLKLEVTWPAGDDSEITFLPSKSLVCTQIINLHKYTSRKNKH